MIPGSIEKSLRRIVEKTFKGRLDLYSFADTSEEGGIRGQEKRLKYAAAPCSLSRIKAAGQRTSISLADEKLFPDSLDYYLLFAEKDLDICANDYAEVFIKGRKYSGRCGEPHIYSSHSETVLKIEKKV